MRDPHTLEDPELLAAFASAVARETLQRKESSAWYAGEAERRAYGCALETEFQIQAEAVRRGLLR